MPSHMDRTISAPSEPGSRPPALSRRDWPQRGEARCSACALRPACLPLGLTATELAQLDSLVCTTRLIHRGKTLYRAGDRFRSIYAVRTGSSKTVVTHRDGHEQITGFQIIGDTLGLDGIHAGRHNCDAIALEDSTVCIIPFERLDQICHEIKALQQHVYQILSGEIVRESSLLLLLGTMTAEQRVAAFLLNLSERYRARGYSSVEFNLRMSRDEIGSYLGLKLETVSRMFSRLQRTGIVAANGKQIYIIDAERLREI
ncbi:fumarate/nitrate reduction transcriptional regulator Fnr [Burkholderia glumae]|uniref:Fumarate/nitrate reduction transcriptional regulator Fnr n=1 Tax=Burkholderia glumae TaxID=337 RepID=A0AAQ0BTK9_BURGL|nr:fumarate/nitrate reduction transcriptional regulator Fnr [Burkholderia glumae]ACR32353.1 Crp/FNR family transcriptional regulator [Burkholderia glumae BGR1]AJY64576.1 bacterial regulatory s, crp family protein [Burkholderia glumae LMG 2196 = ATCC 33617]PJO21446.1 fumarate/nitrate reduction transcriptional regulator Fnr [Burkholderia glumae AU6208]MCR1768401.1 fumarate/nitrate reduction transcriptional regulator Fnr [Burkholderia glumae]NVE25545.1 fumarate/nitrate reduction transcriptional r